MKKLLLFACMFAAVTTTTAQCPAPTCSSTVTITGTATGQNWTGNKCFEGDGAVISNSCNFNSWDTYSFSGMMDIDQTINMPTGARIYTAGVIYFANLNMAGCDTVYVSGQLDIGSRTANNYPNVIFLEAGATLTVGGTAYSAGDTIFNPGNLSNIITVHECEGEPLPIKVSQFSARTTGAGILVEWQAAENPVLQYSTNGKDFKTVYSGFVQQYTHTTPAERNFFRLYDGFEYSGIVFVRGDVATKSERVYISLPPYKTAYVEGGRIFAIIE